MSSTLRSDENFKNIIENSSLVSDLFYLNLIATTALYLLEKDSRKNWNLLNYYLKSNLTMTQFIDDMKYLIFVVSING